jgi:SAM-dependent methyltransferase
MKSAVLEYLACPRCSASFVAEGDPASDGELLDGRLRCAQGHVYPVTRGIPRLAPDVLPAEAQGTVEGFGYEWTHEGANKLRDHDEEQFRDWVAPLGPEDFRGRVVLDAGCGMGRWAACVARAGAKAVVCVDLGDGVESAFANLRSAPNVHVIQADIHRLPLRRAFDLAYSIGVLHHTPDPEKAFGCVASRVAPGGRICAWVYGREGNGWIVWLVDPIRKGVTSRLPRPLLWALSTAITAPLQAFLRLAFRRAPDGAATARFPVPYRAYFAWMARYDFRHNRAIVFDHLVPRLAFYVRREDFRGWFARQGIADPLISSRNGNSWRGLGVVP